MKNITVHLAEGFEEIEAITIIDVLRRAKLNAHIVSMTNQLTVTGSHNLPVTADLLFDDVDFENIDLIILPGGMPGTKNLDAHTKLKRVILDFHQQNKPIGAICAAPLVLGHLNILKGKTAVCYPGYEGDLYGANVIMQPVAVDGNIITGRGVGAALKFSLKIVELFASKDKADQLGKAMLVAD